MFKKIEKPAACEMRSVIHFFNARNMKPADIHRQLCEVYGEHAITDLLVRRWVRHSNEGRENVHDDPRSRRPSVVNEDLVRADEEKFKRTDDSPFRHFPCIFYKFHCHFFTILCLENFVFRICVRAGVYCDTLKKLRRAIQNKRRGMLSRGVVMLHDNARPHTAAATQDLIATFGWEQFDHPPTAQT
jgi:hypothetical protein